LKRVTQVLKFLNQILKKQEKEVIKMSTRQGKRLSIIVGSGCLILTLAALVPYAHAAPATPTPYHWPEKVIIGTDAGTAWTYTSAIAPVLGKLMGTKVRVVSMSATNELYKRLGEKEFSLMQVLPTSTEVCITGRAEGRIYEKYPIRYVWYTFDAVYGYFTRADFPVKYLRDIKQYAQEKGIRIAVNMGSSGSRSMMMGGIPAYLGWTQKEAEANGVKFVPLGSMGAHVKSVVEGAADVAAMGMSSSLAYEVAAGPAGLHVLEMPAKEKEAWLRYGPWFPIARPAVLDYGVKAAVGAESFKLDGGFFARADTDEEFVYQFCHLFPDS
jgi:TRAP-type uncharacterized transport system substrate-binding protein